MKKLIKIIFFLALIMFLTKTGFPDSTPPDEVKTTQAPLSRPTTIITSTSPPPNKDDDAIMAPRIDKSSLSLGDITKATFTTSEQFYELCDSPEDLDPSDPRFLAWTEKCKNVPLNDYLVLYKNLRVWPEPASWANAIVPIGPKALAANFPSVYKKSTVAFARLTGKGRIIVVPTENYFYKDFVQSFSPITGKNISGKDISTAMNAVDPKRYPPARAAEFIDAPKLIQNIMIWASLSSPNNYGTFLTSTVPPAKYRFLQNVSNTYHDFHPDYRLQRVYVSNFYTNRALLNPATYPFILIRAAKVSDPAREYPEIKKYIEAGGGVILYTNGYFRFYDSDPLNAEQESVNNFLKDFDIKVGLVNYDIKENYPLYDQALVNSYTFLPAKFIKVATDAKERIPPLLNQPEIDSLVGALNNLPDKHTYYFPSLIPEMYAEIFNPLYDFTRDPLRLPGLDLNKIYLVPPEELEPTFKTQLALYKGLAMMQPDSPYLRPEDGTFPGYVGRATGIIRQISFDVYNPDLNGRRDPSGVPKNWFFSGLYAPPGKVIEVNIDDADIADLEKLQIQIGLNSDDNINKSYIYRFPKISMNFTGLKLGKNTFRNPFGGLLVLKGDKNTPSLRNIKLTIKGCVDAPHVKKSTTKADLDYYKTLPVPQGVIEADRVVLVVPKNTINGTLAPAAGQPPPAITALNNLYANLYDLLGFKSDDPNALHHPWVSKHWHVVDVQISMGSAHSGFPAMFSRDYAKTWKDPVKMETADWGLYHEQGHNWQYKANKTSVDTEVTNNFFPEYIYNLTGKSRAGNYSSILTALSAGTANYYVGDAWHQLRFWVQLFQYTERYKLPQKIGGWDIVRTHYRYSRAVNDTQRDLEKNSTDSQKDNQLCLLFSKWTGFNLVSFFNKWKRTITPATQSQIEAIPGIVQPTPEIWTFDPFAP